MDKEFRQYSRTMAEECTKEQLVDLYIAEVETCVEVEEQLRITEKQCVLMAQHIREDLKCDDTEDEIYKYFKEQAIQELNNEENS